MITYVRKAGTADVSVVIRIIDATDGTPETGVAYNTSGIDLQYRRELEASTAITEATLAALTTAHSDGGFLHIGNGYYRLDLPDAACAAGATGVVVHGIVTGMVVIGCYIQLVAYDPFDTVRLGLTALPNVAIGSAGAIITSGTGTAQLSVTGGLASANTTQFAGQTITAAAGVTLPSSVASPTNITAATGITLTPTTGLGTQTGTIGTVTNQLTAAQIATGVWQDATAGDFTTASSIGKALYIANVAPGAAGGHFIAGTNAATSITTALTANITGNLSGSVGSVTGAVGSVTGAVGSVTGAVGSVTGAVGSVTGNVGGNVVGTVGTVNALAANVITAASMNDDASTEIRDKIVARTTIRGTAAGTSTTSITTSAFGITTTASNQLVGRIVIFDPDTTTTGLRGQATDITASTASATPTLTVTALTTAPAAGDLFTIV